MSRREEREASLWATAEEEEDGTMEEKRLGRLEFEGDAKGKEKPSHESDTERERERETTLDNMKRRH